MVREQIRENQSDAREGQQAVFQERTIQSRENFLKEKRRRVRLRVAFHFGGI